MYGRAGIGSSPWSWSWSCSAGSRADNTFWDWIKRAGIPEWYQIPWLLLTWLWSYSCESCVKTAWFSSLGHSACRTISTRWKLDQSRGHLQFPKPCEQLLQQVSKNKMRDESATGWPICCLQYIPKPIFGWIIQQNSDRNLSRRAPVFFQCGNWKQKRKNPITAVQRELAGELLRWSR